MPSFTCYPVVCFLSVFVFFSGFLVLILLWIGRALCRGSGRDPGFGHDRVVMAVSMVMTFVHDLYNHRHKLAKFVVANTDPYLS